MGKLADILISGRAPGVRLNAVDPGSVFAKVPKALKEIENGTRGQRPMSARDIAKHMGSNVGALKEVWSRSNPKAF